MIIAIIGAGKVGTTLGRRFADVGHNVVYGVRDVGDIKYSGLAGTNQRVDTVPLAAAQADVVVLTTPWANAQTALAAAADLTGKVLVDATNPIGPGMVLTHGTNDSGAEQVARWVPGARVVKAFNSVGMEVMANARFGEARAVLATCGDDLAACELVNALANEIGFEAIRLGPLTRARFIEPAALVWITAAQVVGTRDFAWGMLRRG